MALFNYFMPAVSVLPKPDGLLSQLENHSPRARLVPRPSLMRAPSAYKAWLIRNCHPRNFYSHNTLVSAIRAKNFTREINPLYGISLLNISVFHRHM